MLGFHQCINAVSLALVLAFGTAIIVKPEPISLTALSVCLGFISISKILEIIPSNKNRIEDLECEVERLNTNLKKITQERGLTIDDFSH